MTQKPDGQGFGPDHDISRIGTVEEFGRLRRRISRTAGAWRRSLSFLAALVTHSNPSAGSFFGGSATTRRPEETA
jgi:hypothetical protein